MSNKTKMIKDVVRDVIDVNTGELIETSVQKHFVTKVEQDNFFMVFFDKLGSYFGLKSGKDRDLIIALCELAEFNTGIVKITTKAREELCTKVGLHTTNLSKALGRLQMSGLIKGEKGEYTINPKIFWKGSNSTRTEILKNEGITFNITLTS